MDLLEELTYEFRSGEALAADLGVSRAAVSKAAKALIDEGYPIEVERAHGYKLRDGTPVPGALREVLIRRFGSDYRYLGRCASTQDELRTWAESGAPEGAVVLAETQTEGRGRHGRTWESASGLSLTFSVLLRPTSAPVTQLPLLSLVAGLAIARFFGHEDAPLTWPNDLLIGGRKLAGVLTESKITAEEPEYVLVGIGMNFDPPAPAGGIAFTETRSSSADRTRVDVFAGLLGSLEDLYAGPFLHADATTIIDEWKQRTGMLGANVRVETPGGTITGHARDLDPTGALIVATPDGDEIIHAGDVTLVREEGTDA